MTRRNDPEPITIIAAIAAVTGASISAVNYWRTHHKPLPHEIRARLISYLDRLARETRELKTNVGQAESVFRHALFPNGRTLRLGNGALLTADEFAHYSEVADQIFGRLKRLHRLALKVQGLAFDLPYTDKRDTTNSTGDLLAKADRLMQLRDFSVDSVWHELRSLADEFEQLIKRLRSEIRSG